MASTIYLIRHAESVHNVSKDFSHRDPPLTELGIAQASALGKSFPGLASVAIVLTSPLTRTLETTLAAFSHILDKQSVGDGGIDAGARLVLDPDLQERSDLPCDTGSDRATLEEKFQTWILVFFKANGTQRTEHMPPMMRQSRPGPKR